MYLFAEVTTSLAFYRSIKFNYQNVRKNCLWAKSDFCFVNNISEYSVSVNIQIVRVLCVSLNMRLVKINLLYTELNGYLATLSMLCRLVLDISATLLQDFTMILLLRPKSWHISNHLICS